MTSPIETNNVVERLKMLEAFLMKHHGVVPDDIQSEVRMEFNEALAGGPNMNGDGGPTLSSSHALDCVWATQRIQSLSDRIDELTKALVQIGAGQVNGEAEFRRRLGSRSRPIWHAVNALQDYLAASGGTARASLEACNAKR